MIRQPTPRSRLYAWHAAALRREAPGFNLDEPQCGWYRTKLFKGGPWVPARIWCHQVLDRETGELTEDERLIGEIAGRRFNPDRDTRWWFFEPITEQEWRALSALHASDNTFRATHARVDLSRESIRP